ncbi:MAG: hypothetical protein HOO91_08200 [Bacteroidales bacterium]|nr:hypothetical protein [Bacteroidales bacterium]
MPRLSPAGCIKISSATSIGDTLIASTNENLTYFSIDKGNTWEKYAHGFNEAQRSSKKVSLGNMNISIDGKNYISINGTDFQPIGYSEEINSLFIHDSFLYIGTTNDLYKLPIIEFCKKHLFDFMNGEWNLSYWQNEYYNNPAKDYVNFTKFRIDDKKIYWYKAGFDTNLNFEIVYQYSCGEYTDMKDSTGSTIEKNPILSFTFREVDLAKELDKDIPKLGFSIISNQIFIDKTSSISSNS